MTKDTPTVPGFYFYKQTDFNMGKAIVARVYKGRKKKRWELTPNWKL
jgi:hypothetical protein